MKTESEPVQRRGGLHGKDGKYENGTPCWIDLGTSDVPASVAFYKALFGWAIEIGPAEMGHYSMAMVDGETVAAIADQQNPGQVYWTTYLAADDVDATVAKARTAGGTVLMEPMDVMTFGRMAVIVDVGGAAVSILAGRRSRSAGLVNEPGTLCWNELTTRAVPESLTFYEAVAGLHGAVRISVARTTTGSSFPAVAGSPDCGPREQGEPAGGGGTPPPPRGAAPRGCVSYMRAATTRPDMAVSAATA